MEITCKKTEQNLYFWEYPAKIKKITFSMDKNLWKLWKQPAILKKTGKNEEKNPVKLKTTCKKKRKNPKQLKIVCEKTENNL